MVILEYINDARSHERKKKQQNSKKLRNASNKNTQWPQTNGKLLLLLLTSILIKHKLFFRDSQNA